MSEITAIYENGILRPLTPLTFSEGQQVRLQVLPESLPSVEQIDRVLKPLVEAGLLTLPPKRGEDTVVCKVSFALPLTRLPKLKRLPMHFQN